MSALILNMQVVAQLAHVLSDALRLYAYAVARWFIEGEERARDMYTRGWSRAWMCATVST